MKTVHILVVLLGLTMAGGAWSAGKSAHSHAPLHGSVVTEAHDADYELVAKPDIIRLYVRHHNANIDLQQTSAKVTLLTGSEKSEITLVPVGEKLEAKGKFNVVSGTKIVAIVTRPGKSAQSVRFAIK
jgi:hypothetical protein